MAEDQRRPSLKNVTRSQRSVLKGSCISQDKGFRGVQNGRADRYVVSGVASVAETPCSPILAESLHGKRGRLKVLVCPIVGGGKFCGAGLQNCAGLKKNAFICTSKFYNNKYLFIWPRKIQDELFFFFSF